MICATGEGVAGYEIGDRVFANAAGSFAQFAVASPDQLACITRRCSFIDAAGIPESGVVALQAVTDHGRVVAGQRLAVVGAGGGVGSYAVQIAKAAHAHVTGVCAPRKRDAVRALGADVVAQDISASVDGGGRFDVIIDTAGTIRLRRLRHALTPNGTLVIVGADLRHRATGGLGRWIRALLWTLFVSRHLRPFIAQPVDRRDLDRLVELVEGDQPTADQGPDASSGRTPLHKLRRRDQT